MKRVLIVEDMPDNRQIISDLLTSAGYEPIEAIDGAAGVVAALAHRPDLILMDIQLPVIDGYEATRRIKAIDRNIKVLIVSMYDDERLISGCLAAGASGYVRMDSHSVHLRNAITNVCRRSAHAA